MFFYSLFLINMAYTQVPFKEKGTKRGRYNVVSNSDYLMENPEENLRLEKKTRENFVRKQAQWCGIKPGMRILDAGCGPGRTTSFLRHLIHPGGSIVGVDYSKERINYAKEKYGGGRGISFRLYDIRNPMKDMGAFDLIWARFVLEYNREESFEIVRNLTASLKPGGLLCLIDLDYNCLTHYELPTKMEGLIMRLTKALELEYNFDPYVGRKLYAYLYDLEYEEVEVEVKAHHLFYGKVGENDIFNWLKKVEVITSKKKDLLSAYSGGREGFSKDFKKFFTDPRRFTYTPVIICKGRKPI
jgi:SAM-dependent methyltransferase